MGVIVFLSSPLEGEAWAALTPDEWAMILEQRLREQPLQRRPEDGVEEISRKFEVEARKQKTKRPRQVQIQT
jgi:hypothetical protein